MYDPTSFAQQAITYLCLNFNGDSPRFNELPRMKCPSGIRSQIVCAPKMRSLVRKTQHVVQNFPSCWDGVVCANRPFNAYRILKWLSFQNTDSPDHRSHVSFLSAGPDNGTCADPQFPKTLPRIFMEVRKCHILITILGCEYLYAYTP